jgi:preprotein translocase subunit SecA
MQPHHFDPLTGEDEFLAEEQEGAPKSRQERRAAAKQGNGGSPAARKAGGRDGAAPGGKPQQAKGRGQRAPAGPAVDPGNPASWGKVARNAMCPCGSGKKFKHCHGAIASAAAE